MNGPISHQINIIIDCPVRNIMCRSQEVRLHQTRLGRADIGEEAINVGAQIHGLRAELLCCSQHTV
jgi:hypothetical protein